MKYTETIINLNQKAKAKMNKNLNTIYKILDKYMKALYGYLSYYLKSCPLKEICIKSMKGCLKVRT